MCTRFPLVYKSLAEHFVSRIPLRDLKKSTRPGSPCPRPGAVPSFSPCRLVSALLGCVDRYFLPNLLLVVRTPPLNSPFFSTSSRLWRPFTFFASPCRTFLAVFLRGDSAGSFGFLPSPAFISLPPPSTSPDARPPVKYSYSPFPPKQSSFENNKRTPHMDAFHPFSLAHEGLPPYSSVYPVVFSPPVIP